MQIWFEFYAVIGAASATLLGLLFVAVSMNLSQSLGIGHENSRNMAEQAFQNYIAVILVALLALMPSQSMADFGLSALLTTGASGLWVLVRLYRALTRPYPSESQWTSLRRHISAVIGFGLLLFAAWRMWMGDDSRNMFAVGAIVLLSSATLVSWELLLRMARAGRPTENPSK